MHHAKYAAALAVSIMAAPAAAQSLVGEWVATAKTSQGDFAEKLSVSRTGETYAIAVEQISELPPGVPAAGPGIEVVLDGDKFSYKRVVSFPGGSVDVFYDGVVSGDSFAGLVEIDGIPGTTPYSGVRVKPAAQ